MQNTICRRREAVVRPATPGLAQYVTKQQAPASRPSAVATEPNAASAVRRSPGAAASSSCRGAATPSLRAS
eukprot:10537583-Lingulodinium_polyedra.AAC.1